MFDLPSGVVDAWINPNIAPLSGTNDVSHLFPDLRDLIERGTSLEQLIDEMDEAGVEKGLLCSGYSCDGDHDWAVAARDKFPERFGLSHVVDPREGMRAVRHAQSLVESEGYCLIRMLGLQTQLPYNDPAYYPVYAKCVELGVPVGLNVGFPGPRVPSKHPHPLAVDDVAAFFPELTIVLQHGGEPWVDTCVKLMVKWPQISYMSSALAPKHIPKPVIDYVHTRGADRVMFASDYPLFTNRRCMSEVRELPFKDAERFEKFGAANATKLFFAA
ncbi:MAG TPA: amidohydrolase family protein [Mycobacterium sp.]